MQDEASSNDLPLSANVQDTTVKHFALDLACKMEDQVFEGSITLWCLPTVREKRTSERMLPREDDASVFSKEHVGVSVKSTTRKEEQHENDLMTGQGIRDSSVTCKVERAQSLETSMCGKVERLVHCTGQTVEQCVAHNTGCASGSGSCVHHTDTVIAVGGKDQKTCVGSQEEERDCVKHQGSEAVLEHFLYQIHPVK